NRELGSTVIIVTHNAPIGAMANRIARMSSGMIVEIIENTAPVSPERIEW
ncbi:MAG: ABC transporter related, partial [Desulfotomaculum sp. 46_296]